MEEDRLERENDAGLETVTAPATVYTGPVVVTGWSSAAAR